MSDLSNFDVSVTTTSPEAPVSSLTAPTALASALHAAGRGEDLRWISFCGRQTVAQFTALEAELRAALQTAVVFDLGWRTRIVVTGEDRLRWLSGMVTNAVQLLPEHEGNYSFFLNAQGKIQGDAYVYREAGRLLLDTSFDQVETIAAHLDRFIIMDDVTLESSDAMPSGLGLAGPKAAALLAELGADVPETSASLPVRFADTQLDGVPVTLVAMSGTLTPRFEIFCAAADIAALWDTLTHAGVMPCGVEAVEALRVLEGIPRYGVDLTERDLPQETGQTRALNFNKGCYLGQEIVERIRSRGAVHKALRQFELQGAAPVVPAEVMADGVNVGLLTSAVSFVTENGIVRFGLGIVRNDAVSKAASVTYNGGSVLALDRPPTVF